MSEDLRKRCFEVADHARAALDWVSNPANADVVGNDRKLVAKELRRDELRAKQLAEAVERPMSIGVYGPSQAGKSYLVSVLAKPQDGRLVAAVGDGMDFIKEINPEGDKEATGLVTRFTMRRPDTAPGFPVTVKLLSEADVIRILVNTFFRDGDNTETPPTVDQIASALGSARSRAGRGTGLTETDVWDIQTYYETHFRTTVYAQAVTPFWEEAAELLPGLGVNDRAPLLEMLWGGHPTFTELYRTLATALDALGHPATANAGVEALTPRTTSIIDVATLFGLDGIGDNSPVSMRSDGGKEASIPRSVVAALTAELVLPMAEQPWPLFEDADLLDFPGVRERKAARGGIATFIADSEAPKKELFLRGKVGFLFERYVARQELTSMLLCIPPSNVNVAADLSAGIDDWIARTQGASAEERAKVDTMLFLVLTMFDRHLADPAGSLDPMQRFENRFEASLIAPFGGLRDSWPLNWTPDTPFRNSFWLRNPNFPAEHVIRYENGREMNIHDFKEDRLAELKSGCLSAPLVQRHMEDAEACWEAAMTLNDGGVRRIVDRLTPVATSAVKERQIAARLAELSGRITRRLKPFYSDSDVAKRLAARRAAAQGVLKELRRSFENRRFGRVVEELGISSDALVWRLERIPAGVQIVTADSAPDDDDWMQGDLDLETSAGEADDADAEPISRSMTLERFRAEAAVTAWQERLQAFADRQDLPVHVGLSPKAASEIAIEFGSGARRLRLAERIEKDLTGGTFRKAGVETAAWLSASRICDLVTTAGVCFVAADQQPVLKNKRTGETRPIFQKAPQKDDAMDLPETPKRHDWVFFQDWTFALYSLFEDNARSEDGVTVNVEQNERLGTTIAGLEGSGGSAQ